jgi:hypothetical protein
MTVYSAHVHCIGSDERIAEDIREAFGDLSDRVAIAVIDRDGVALPAIAAHEQAGTAILIASSTLLRAWFGGAGWADVIAAWRTAGGRALIVHPDTSTGPFDWPELELGHVRAHARHQVLSEFLDVPRPLALRFDAEHEDDGPGALEHARGVLAWQRADMGLAASHFERAVAARDALHSGDPRRAASENALGAALARAGRFAESIPHLERALLRRRTWLGTESPQAAASANNLGIALLSAGEPARAARLLTRATEAMLALGSSYDARARACAAHAAVALDAAGDPTSARAWAHIAARRTPPVSHDDDVLLN